MKKLTKRRMYNRRRRKEKVEQHKKSLLPRLTSSNKFNVNNSKQYQQNANEESSSNYGYNPLISSPTTSYFQGLQLWWQTYCSAIEFHTRQQQTWQDERNRMTDHQLTLLEKYANEYETSSEEDNEETIQHTINTNSGNNEIESIDEGYLKFLEITHKHREELRAKRAQQNV